MAANVFAAAESKQNEFENPSKQFENKSINN